MKLFMNEVTTEVIFLFIFDVVLSYEITNIYQVVIEIIN